MIKHKQQKTNALHFHKVIRALKLAEKSKMPVRINGQKLSNFLIAHSDYLTSASSIPNQVKIAILKTTGDKHPDPTTVSDATPMAGYGFKFPAYSKLTQRFNGIAQVTNPKANIQVSAVQACSKVSDCIELVTQNS